MNDSIPYTLPPNFPPAWAAGWGEDEHGVFAELPLSEEHLTMEMRWIPSGSFIMGSPDDERGRIEREGPQHEVTLSQGFWLAQTPCTRAQWRAVMEDTRSHWRAVMEYILAGKKEINNPMSDISWEDCQVFCERLRVHFAGFECCLPTEAQWEYACRAGTQTAFNDGSGCTNPSGEDSALNKMGWYDKNSNKKLHPVAAKHPNRWGLYDMHGHVWEWCQDWYSDYNTESKNDPKRNNTDQFRILRGGCYWRSASYCRSAYRTWNVPSNKSSYFGFRLAAGQ